MTPKPPLDEDEREIEIAQQKRHARALASEPWRVVLVRASADWSRWASGCGSRNLSRPVRAGSGARLDRRRLRRRWRSRRLLAIGAREARGDPAPEPHRAPSRRPRAGPGERRRRGGARADRPAHRALRAAGRKPRRGARRRRRRRGRSSTGATSSTSPSARCCARSTRRAQAGNRRGGQTRFDGHGDQSARHSRRGVRRRADRLSDPAHRRNLRRPARTARLLQAGRARSAPISRSPAAWRLATASCSRSSATASPRRSRRGSARACSTALLTARVGLSALAVCRPAPFGAQKAPGVSDVAPFLFGGGKKS